MNDFLVALFTEPHKTRKNQERCANCPAVYECQHFWSGSKSDQIQNCSIVRACKFRHSIVNKARFWLGLMIMAAIVLAFAYACYKTGKSRADAIEAQINALTTQFPDFTDREFLRNNTKSITQELRLIEAAGFRVLQLKSEENFAIFKLNGGKIWITELSYDGNVASRSVF